jgi:hypothetical protein
MKEVISQEIIENFLNGGDPEEFIVGVEYDYPTNTIFKIIQDPVQGKIVKPDTYTPFLWVGDLFGLGFYSDSKSLQKKAMAKHGIVIDKLETYGNERLELGMKYLVKSIKSYTNLTSFFREGGIDPWNTLLYYHLLNNTLSKRRNVYSKELTNTMVFIDLYSILRPQVLILKLVISS